MADKLHIEMTVEGTLQELTSFVELCKVMDLLGSAGASRLIRVPYDGDGSARLKFDFGTTDVSMVEIDEAIMDQDEITVSIGE